jgi:hypothetical protein
VPGVRGDRQPAQLAGGNGDSERIAAGVQLSGDPQPGAGAGAGRGDRGETTWWLLSVRPRQFIVSWGNSRCSILFQLEVPGGKCQIVILRPVSAASAARSSFRNR